MTTVPHLPSPAADALALDRGAEVARLTSFLRHQVARVQHRRGVVVAVSGGVDSAVCAALATAALGPERVQALFLPGQHTPPDARDRVQALCRTFGLTLHERSIVPVVQALGGYAARDAALRRVFPDYQPGQRYKVRIAAGLLDHDRANLFDLVLEDGRGGTRQARLPLPAWLQLLAATNLKQRCRAVLSHHAADALNYAVVGTPNRAEHALGFFVRGGDGLADVAPIAHLYKTQVYALADHLGVPEAIRRAAPSTDTYSLPQSQQEFYFALDHQTLDRALWAHDHGLPAAALAGALGWTPEQAERVYADLARKKQQAARQHQPAVTVPEPA